MQQKIVNENKMAAIKIAFLLLSIIYMAHGKKCTTVLGTEQTCPANSGSDYSCMVTSVVVVGCVTEALEHSCNENKMGFETCCCYSDNCNKDLATCKSGSMKQYASLLMMVLAPLVSMWMM